MYPCCLIHTGAWIEMKGVKAMAGNGSIRKRKDGLFELRYIIGHKPDGKPRYKSFYGKSKGEVRQKRDDFIKSENEKYVAKMKIGMSDWSMKWAKLYKQGSVSDATFKSTYLFAIKNYINPYFKDCQVSDILNSDVQAFFKKYEDKSSSVLSKIKLTLNQIFESAVDNDIIIKNPCRNIKLKKYEAVNTKRTYTSSEVKKNIEYAKTNRDGIGIIIMLKTGIRRSELLALRWSDIDFNKNIIKIVRAVKSGGYIGEPKSKAGIRTIPIDNELSEYLSTMFEAEDRDINDYIIKNHLGSYMEPTNYDSRNYKDFMNSMAEHFNNKMEKLTAHELRHTYGTLLRERGVDIYTIQKVMGHENIDITAKTYVHNDLNVLIKNMNLDH